MRLWIAIAIVVSLLSASAAEAQSRLALLIGNQDYSGRVQPLKSPHNDIGTVGKALASVGFKVTTLRDAGRLKMLIAVNTFGAALAKGGPDAVGFLYYSGHGVARPENHANYLIPVDLTDTGSTDFWFAAVKLDDILGELERVAPFAAHFVVFDACRDDLKLPYKSVSKGFEAVAERSGMFIAFSTALGAVALDEGKASGSSGPYASALAAELVRPGQDHLQLFQNVKEGVFASTARRQVPWERNGLLKRIYFGGRAKAAKPGAQSAQAELASRLQSTLKNYECYDGPVDGIWNERSEQALARFARLNGSELESLKPTIENIMRVEGAVSAACGHDPVEPSARQPESQGCVPKANAQLFSEPHRDKFHPDFRGVSLGSSWSLMDVQIIANSTGRYVYGKLYSPRGGYQKWVYSLAEQWECK